jgi:exodeoxyribonuclease VII small subunit
MEKDKLTYEEGIKELEGIVQKLESNDLTLEQSLNYFKRGVELYKYLYEILNKVEGEIEVILKDEDKNLTEVGFDLGD